MGVLASAWILALASGCQDQGRLLTNAARFVAPSQSAPEQDQNAFPAGQPQRQELRKVVREGVLAIIVPDPETAIQQTAEIAEQTGGYVQQMQTSEILIRVPAEAFDRTVKQVSNLGTVHRRHISAVDVSGEYTDLELRIENLRALAETYRKMLGQVEAVEDALKVQRELARVTGELERLEQQFRKLGSRIQYASLEARFVASPDAPSEFGTSLPFVWLNRLGVDELMSR